jgi:hypothetical protein
MLCFMLIVHGVFLKCNAAQLSVYIRTRKG